MAGDEKGEKEALKNDTTDLKEEKKKEKSEMKPEGFSFAVKPEERHGWDAFSHFVWNPETKQFLGRTGMSWLKITVFYIIYYTFLAGFFMLMLLAFFTTLYDEKPTWDASSNGIIGTNPGVGYRPMPPDERIESTLVWYRHGNRVGNWEPWVERLEEHMKPYKNNSYTKDLGGHAVECGDLGSKSPGTKGICQIKQEELFKEPCTYEKQYGFKDGAPCILIKLNKIYQWYPDPYETEDEMPKDIPETIKKSFRDNIANNRPELNNRVWLECDGENPADKENLGPITYYPTNGVSGYYYPYLNQKGYLSPVIFARLERPKHGVLIAIECKAWARNIDHDSQDRKGLVHFELMID